MSELTQRQDYLLVAIISLVFTPLGLLFIKSEIDEIRKSVVSMSVGQPGRTSTIVKEWLEQPAPAPPEPEEESDSGDDGDEE